MTGQAGGSSIYRRISTADTNDAIAHAGACKLYGLRISNINAAARYLKLYDVGVAPTVGTTVPKMTILVPGATTGGVAVADFPTGIAFANGIGVGISTGSADADTGAAGAGDQVIHLFYR